MHSFLSSHLSLSKHHHHHHPSTHPHQHQHTQGNAHHYPTAPNLHASGGEPTIELPRLIHNALSCNELFQPKYNYHSLTSRLHFHLAGSIELDLALFANNAHTDSAKFVVHWMNNKELNFNIASEQFFHEIVDRLRKEQCHSQNPNDPEADDSDDNNVTYDISASERQKAEQKMALLCQSMDHRLDKIIKDWYSSQDLLFCIHPLDGSMLIWLVDWLDEYLPGNYRQPVVSFHAKLPNAISVGDAMSLTNSVFLYSQQMQLFSKATQAYIDDKYFDRYNTSRPYQYILV